MKRLLLVIAVIGLLPLLPQAARAADNYQVCCAHTMMDSASNCESSKFYKWCKVLPTCNGTYDTLCKDGVPKDFAFTQPVGNDDTPAPENSSYVWCCQLGADCKKTSGCDKRPAGQCGGDFPQDCSKNTAAPVAKTFEVKNALNTPYLQVVIGNFANLLVGLTGSIALLIFVWAGITMITAEGDPKKIETAKKMMVWTVVGLLVIFASEALVRFVLGALLTGTAS